MDTPKHELGRVKLAFIKPVARITDTSSPFEYSAKPITRYRRLMEIFDFLLSILGNFVVKAINGVLGTKIKLGHGGEIVTGLITLVLLCFTAFWSIRGLVAVGYTH